MLGSGMDAESARSATLGLTDIAALKGGPEGEKALRTGGHQFATIGEVGLQKTQLNALAKDLGLSVGRVLDEMGKVLHTDRDKVLKRIRKGEFANESGGKLGQYAVLEAIRNLTHEGKLGEFASKSAQSIPTLMVNSQERWANLSRSFDAEKALPGVARLRHALNDEASAFDTSTKSGKDLVLTLQSFSNTSYEVQASWKSFLTGLTRSFSESFSEVTRALGVDQGAWDETGDAAGRLGTMIGKVGTVAGYASAALENLGGVLDGFALGIGHFGQEFVHLAKALDLASHGHLLDADRELLATAKESWAGFTATIEGFRKSRPFDMTKNLEPPPWNMLGDLPAKVAKGVREGVHGGSGSGGAGAGGLIPWTPHNYGRLTATLPGLSSSALPGPLNLHSQTYTAPPLASLETLMSRREAMAPRIDKIEVNVHIDGSHLSAEEITDKVASALPDALRQTLRQARPHPRQGDFVMPAPSSTGVPFWILNLNKDPRRLAAMEARWASALTQTQLQNPFQQVKIDDVVMPGWWSLRTLERKIVVQRNRAQGADNGSISFRGSIAPDFELDAEFYTPSHWAAWINFVPKLDMTGDPRERKRHVIEHPFCTLVGVKHFCCLKFRYTLPDQGGPLRLKLGCVAADDPKDGASVTPKAQALPKIPTIDVTPQGAPTENLNALTRGQFVIPPSAGR